jgi:hypothetical protein
MSTLSGGPNIVVDGLVLALDAANTKSYVSGSTAWTDLSRSNNNGTLTNGPTFNGANGGSIVFDGTNDFINSNNSINTGLNFTVSVWFRRTVGSNRGGLVANSYPYSTNVGWYFLINSNNDFAFSVGRDQAFVTTNSNVITNNIWYNVVSTTTGGGTDIKIYINSIVQVNAASLFTSVPIVYTTSNFKIGGLVSPVGDYFGGNISIVQIYNRALSATEILQNYNATKGRFGL